MYLYLKAAHIIFIVTWFAGMFYIVRLFIYNTEANDKPEPDKTILQNQFTIMIKRLWLGITWPSAIITLILGPTVWYHWSHWEHNNWIVVKLCFVAGLYAYHFSLHRIYKQQMSGTYKYSSGKLRIWNEVATIFLVAIVMLAVVKESFSFIYGIVGIVLLMIILFSCIKIYKIIRGKKQSP